MTGTSEVDWFLEAVTAPFGGATSFRYGHSYRQIMRGMKQASGVIALFWLEERCFERVRRETRARDAEASDRDHGGEGANAEPQSIYLSSRRLNFYVIKHNHLRLALWSRA